MTGGPAVGRPARLASQPGATRSWAKLQASALPASGAWSAAGAARRRALGDSLTVEQRTLTPLVEVRILVPQPVSVWPFLPSHPSRWLPTPGRAPDCPARRAGPRPRFHRAEHRSNRARLSLPRTAAAVAPGHVAGADGAQNLGAEIAVHDSEIRRRQLSQGHARKRDGLMIAGHRENHAAAGFGKLDLPGMKPVDKDRVAGRVEIIDDRVFAPRPSDDDRCIRFANIGRAVGTCCFRYIVASGIFPRRGLPRYRPARGRAPASRRARSWRDRNARAARPPAPPRQSRRRPRPSGRAGFRFPDVRPNSACARCVGFKDRTNRHAIPTPTSR